MFRRALLTSALLVSVVGRVAADDYSWNGTSLLSTPTLSASSPPPQQPQTAASALLSIGQPAAGLSVPSYSSKPGAAYTVYLDFGGFSFSGNWGPGTMSDGVTPYTPGVTPAFSTDADTSTFSAADLSAIQQTWSWVAQKYAPFNVNVTTVDPAVAAGQAGSDSTRQAYYDNTRGLMHTVIGGSGGWLGASAGGVSYTDVTQYRASDYSPGTVTNGLHTNWIFADEAPTYIQFLGEASSHENGHGFNLEHHSVGSDAAGSTTPYTEYFAGTGTGPGSRAPTMGVSYYAERGLWMNSPYNANFGSDRETNPNYQPQNDVAVILSNAGMMVTPDSIGHTRAAATSLALVGTTIDSTGAKGIIVPANPNDLTQAATSSNAVPSASTSDYFSFRTTGGTVVINLVSGWSTITPGTADPGATLDGAFDLLDSSGNVMYTRNDLTSLNESLTATLAAGDYTIHVYGPADTLDYYNIGSFYLTGSIAGAIAPVPEPTSVLAVTAVGLALATRLRRAKVS